MPKGGSWARGVEMSPVQRSGAREIHQRTRHVAGTPGVDIYDTQSIMVVLISDVLQGRITFPDRSSRKFEAAKTPLRPFYFWGWGAYPTIRHHRFPSIFCPSTTIAARRHAMLLVDQGRRCLLSVRNTAQEFHRACSRSPTQSIGPSSSRFEYSRMVGSKAAVGPSQPRQLQ
jgi:hypothetical protein